MGKNRDNMYSDAEQVFEETGVEKTADFATCRTDTMDAIQRLKRSVATLGERCLTLEQELLRQEIPEKHTQCELQPPLHVTIYYDTGDGYSEEQKIVRPVLLDKTGQASLCFCLPVDASGVRVDPGEEACVIKNLTFSDGQITGIPLGGYLVNNQSFIFSKPDPNILLAGKTVFSTTEEIRIYFEYRRLEEEALLQMLQNLQTRVAQLEQELNVLYQSTSWRITAPIRAIRQRLNKGN